MAYGYNSYGAGASTPAAGWTSGLTAGQKAAATRRANRAAGIPPKTTGRRSRKPRGPAFPQIDARAIAVEGLAKLEDALGALLAEPASAPKVTAELDAKFKTYQKAKALALNPATPGERSAALSRTLRIMNELIAAIL